MADERIVIELDLDTGEITNKFKKIEGKGKQAGKKSGKAFQSGFKQGIGRLDLVVANLQAQAVAKSIQAISSAFRSGINDLRNFSRGIAEINSILPGNDKLTKQATQSLINFSSQFATGTTEQARAFYNIVSAGVRGTAQQIKALEVANTAAVAGLVDIDAAAKVLVSSVNAYSRSGLTATRASDVLFATVREGQTTFSELTDQVGVVAPLASAAGLSFDELGGAIAAITKSGVKTDRAIIGLRAVLTSIVKPAREASDEAKRLGINLTQSGLQAKGFAGFIRDIQQRTGGSAESIAKLFGNVRALTPILQLANSQAANFEDILKRTADSANNTADAFKIIEQNLDFKIAKRSQEIKNFGLIIAQTAQQTFGSVISQVIPSIETIQRGFINFAKITNRFVIAPLELVYNSFRIAFNGINTIVAGAVSLVGKELGKFGKILEDAFGVTKLSENLRTFAETSKEVFDQNAKGLGESVDNLFQGTVFGKTDEFINNLETNLSAAKEKIDTSGIDVTGGGGGDKPEIDTTGATQDVVNLSTAISQLGLGFRSTEAEIKKGVVGLSKAAAFLGQSIKKGIGQGIGAGFGAFGAALVKGENALDAFAKAFLGTLGQMMIQQGTMFILQGLGFSVIPGLQASGGTLIATGGALAIAGGALSALAGGGGAASSVGAASGAGGGGIATGPESGFTEQVEEREEPGTEVNLTINGDVLDSQETGTRIISLINDAFEKDGVVIKGASFA